MCIRVCVYRTTVRLIYIQGKIDQPAVYQRDMYMIGPGFTAMLFRIAQVSHVFAAKITRAYALQGQASRQQQFSQANENV